VLDRRWRSVSDLAFIVRSIDELSGENCGCTPMVEPSDRMLAVSADTVIAGDLARPTVCRPKSAGP
jgi:hypothetical protein